MSRENDSLIGKQLGDYQVQSSLGEGGMARVYKAYHPRLRREVAIKVILSEIAAREGFQARFEREAQVVASLQHPNIVSVYDFKEEDNRTYLVMQYVGGGTLRDQLRGQRPIEPARAINYAIQMARALHHAHQRGIVHRDIKPQNMLVSNSDPNHLLLSDFGIAKLYGSSEATAFSEMPTRSAEAGDGLTHMDQIIGTADYMAPEQATAKAVDARTDVYALGVVLYQMLTGDVPFHSTSLHGLLFQHVYTVPLSIRSKNPHLPEILAEITAKALAKNPADRFQSADEMARALEYANANATNPLASLARSNLATIVHPQAGPAGNAPTLQAISPPQQWANPASQTRQDSYATLEDRNSRITHPSGIALPNTVPSVTGAPITFPTRKRALPLGYLLAAVVLILGIVVFSTRYLPSLSGGSSGGGQNNTGAATAFTEAFQGNDRGWQTGSLNNGVNATQPSGGQYNVTVPANQTAFPYPQNVGALPDTFTLTATIQTPVNPTSTFYGVAFHFSQDNSGISGYALVMNNQGNCLVYKYKAATSTPPAAANCNYSSTGSSSHTLSVHALGSNYSFSIDNKAITLPPSRNSSNTTWNDNDLHGGHLALFFAGQSSGTATVTYTVTSVQLRLS